MIGIRHIFHLNRCVRSYILRKGKEIILISVQNAGKLYVLPQNILGWSVKRKGIELKAIHFGKHIHFLDNLLTDLLHIRHSVQRKMKTDLMSALMHILDQIHVLT